MHVAALLQMDDRRKSSNDIFVSTKEAISSHGEDVLDFREDIINDGISQKTAPLPEKTLQMTSIHEEMTAQHELGDLSDKNHLAPLTL